MRARVKNRLQNAEYSVFLRDIERPFPFAPSTPTRLGEVAVLKLDFSMIGKPEEYPDLLPVEGKSQVYLHLDLDAVQALLSYLVPTHIFESPWFEKMRQEKNLR